MQYDEGHDTATESLLDDVEKGLEQTSVQRGDIPVSTQYTDGNTNENGVSDVRIPRCTISGSLPLCLLSFICGIALATIFQGFAQEPPHRTSISHLSLLSTDAKAISPLSEGKQCMISHYAKAYSNDDVNAKRKQLLEWPSILSPRLFMKNDRFHPVERTAGTEGAWAELYERYVIIDQPEQLGLPPSEPHPFRVGSEAYAIAAFHQTHCLTTLRYAWYKATATSAAVPAYRPTNLDRNVTLEELEGHAKHCFDYLRQSIQCCSDSTLEPFLDDDGISPLSHGSSGYGTVHQCRDYTGLAAWIEDHRLTDFDPPNDNPRRKSRPLEMNLLESRLPHW